MIRQLAGGLRQRVSDSFKLLRVDCGRSHELRFKAAGVGLGGEVLDVLESPVPAMFIRMPECCGALVVWPVWALKIFCTAMIMVSAQKKICVRKW